jgi:hypothetical protein
MTRSFEIEVNPQPHQLNTGCIYIHMPAWKKGVTDTMEAKMMPLLLFRKRSKQVYFV